MCAKNFDDHLQQRLDVGELTKLEHQANLERECLRMLQTDIATAVAKHVRETGMGFNDVSRGLGVSASQVAKIKKAEANLTFTSVAHIAAFLGKKPLHLQK